MTKDFKSWEEDGPLKLLLYPRLKHSYFPISPYIKIHHLKDVKHHNMFVNTCNKLTTLFLV